MSVKVTFELDERVRRALKQAALNTRRPEKEIHEQALRSFLHLDIIDQLGQAAGELSEEEAARTANEEVHAARRERKARSRR
jgi:predicted transcriptional regulator